MKKKKLLKMLADAMCHNQVLTKQNELLAAEIEKMEKLFFERTNEYSEEIKKLRDRNGSLNARVAYLERIKLYGKVTATDYVDASKEAIIEQPPNNKGVLGAH